MQIIEKAVAPLAGEGVGQIGSMCRQMMEKETWWNLPKSKLPGCYDWLVGLIARFYDSVGCAHANWKEARKDHDGVQLPGAIVIGKAVQPEIDWILKNFRFCVRKEKRVVQALEESLEPF